jgi:nicotianamine synthase
MTFSCEDVSVEESTAIREADQNGMRTTTDWTSFQVVFCAALVGMDSVTKIEILGSLARRLAPGTLVVVRSAEGLRGMLYPVRYSLTLVPSH